MYDADGQIAALEAELSRLRYKLADSESITAAQVQSLKQLRQILSQLPCIAWTTDLDLKFTSSVGAALRGLGLQDNEVIGRSLFDFFRTTDPTCLPIARCFDALNGISCRYEDQWMGRQYAVTLEPLRDESGRIAGTIGAAFDITEQKRTEEDLRASEFRYRDLFENANDSIFTLDLGGNFLSVNRTAEQTLGYSRAELIGMSTRDLLPAEEHDQHATILCLQLSGHHSATYEATAVRKDGARIQLELNTKLVYKDGIPVGVHGIARDITERKKLEEQIRHAQKMEAIGALAGGVAHDFNNLLTGILGHADLLRSSTLDQEQKQAIGVIVRSSERAAELTRQLLGFARRSHSRLVPVDLHSTIEEMTDLLARTIDKRIRIENDLRATACSIPGDSTQIYQVLLNLGLNARDAMPDGGVLRFRTTNSGDSLILRVEDTGTGIPDQVRDHIFEPFFTTKESEKGTGMGLAMVYGIVKNHGGTITVASQPNSGTQFEIRLPVCAAGIAEPPEPSVQPAPGGRVLIIDDEQIVREVLARMLRGLGYDAFEAADPNEAITFYRENWRDIDAVIIDLIMPRMGGRNCFAALREINPNVRAVLSTGFGINATAREILKNPGVAFLQKPYELAELSKVMAHTLGNAGMGPNRGIASRSERNPA